MAKTLRYQCVEALIEAGRGMSGGEIAFLLRGKRCRVIANTLTFLSAQGYIIRSGSLLQPFYTPVGHLPPEDDRIQSERNFKGATGARGRYKERKTWHQTHKVYMSPLAQALSWEPKRKDSRVDAASKTLDNDAPHLRPEFVKAPL